MKYKGVFILLFLFTTKLFGVDANEMVRKADLWRGPQSSFEMDVKITSYKGDEKIEQVMMKTYVKDINKTMVKFTSPKSWEGRKMLMLKNDMWMIFPNTSKPIRITPAQRLMGEVANGDIAKMNFSEDYNAKLVGEEKIEGIDCYILELTAKTTEGVTYYRINYWLKKDNYLPIKAEFFALSGKKLKTALYKETKIFNGQERISKIVIYDAIKTNSYSVMEYLDMKERELPDNYFNLGYLQRM